MLSVGCLLLWGCDKHPAKKPDPTKGAVTGIVICSDTGKPARFATVTLSAAPKKGEKVEAAAGLPATESTVTDLEGRFRLEAVEPGRYYAFATLEGYLDPMRGLDFARIGALEGDREQNLDAISQWKDHLTEVTVHVHRTADLTLQVERAAEIAGTVSFDDGSPAIGLHFQLSRKTDKNGWTDVGLRLFSDWSISSTSDSHGRYTLTNLPAGVYKVCAVLPVGTEDSAPRICLGNTFRQKNATTIKVASAEITNGADITIPLNGMHTMAGTVSALADAHALKQATVELLYADDREKARETRTADDGSFSFEYVPEGKYIVRVSGAPDAADTASEPEPRSESAAAKTVSGRRYAEKEIPLSLLDEMGDIQVQLEPTAPDKPRVP
jgi:hypothetical protein